MKHEITSALRTGHCLKTVDSAVIVTMHQFAESLGNAIDAKDPHTSMHSEEVAVMSQTLGLALGLSPHEADMLHIAGHLHDIGKIGVPDCILQKQGPLTSEEWRQVRKHPDMGANIVAPVKAFQEMTGIQEMIRHHHERFDGNGYPARLTGRFIPLGARIIAVADSLSAMLQDRPYRPSMAFDDAVAEVVRCSGTQFDPEIVQALLRCREGVRSQMDMLREGECPCSLPRHSAEAVMSLGTSGSGRKLPQRVNVKELRLSNY